MTRINRSRKTEGLLCLVLFALMLFCNKCTFYLADDFSYMLSFTDRQRITNAWQIFPSMAAHAQTMNGRLVPHFFVQLFLLMPKWVFNLANSALFVGLVWLICRMACGSTRNNYIFAAVFGALWVHTPAFGQVYLWLDGAVNYLWPLVFALAFLLPYVQSFLYDKPVTGVWRWLMPVGALLMGACSENTSSAAVGMAVLLVLLELFLQKKKFDWHKVLCILLATVGYITVYLAPAQWENKSVELTSEVFWENMRNAVLMYKSFAPLLYVMVVLVALNLFSGADRRRIWLAGVLVAGSLFANFIMAVAVVYPQRSALPVCAFLVAALAVLAADLTGNYKRISALLVAMLMVTTCFWVYLGLDDIIRTRHQVMANHDHLVACAQKGIMDPEIHDVEERTKYSALYGLRYIHGNPTEWPNRNMDDYYGLNSIVGVFDEE